MSPPSRSQCTTFPTGKWVPTLATGTAKLKAATRPSLVAVRTELRQAPLQQILGQSMVVEGRQNYGRFRSNEEIGDPGRMIELLRLILSTLASARRSRHELLLQNLLLRQQLDVALRSRRRPPVARTDRRRAEPSPPRSCTIVTFQ